MAYREMYPKLHRILFFDDDVVVQKYLIALWKVDMDGMDDLTHQLPMIIRHDENLRRQERNGAPAHIISKFA
ncbi:hypothetical protein CTI12_AA562310 [Artemisia annua]|uniref:Hexosyltransferase n=1 Tax=Artemisia annua TaxID=35608 RepID=A0A2U1KUR4_ARTAN|nr:hypothetical protein CTI12_AA562310 [Artemisia annua]